MSPLPVAFVGGRSGAWRVERLDAVSGAALPAPSHLSVVEGPLPEEAPAGSIWTLRGVTSNERYVEREERDTLVARAERLGRPDSTCAALIAIDKSEVWWELAQDERLQIFAERSRHVAVGREYLPAVARRLLHGRELREAFDFLTWFEFAPQAAASFEQLVQRLRATEEWSYVEREVDIRLAREVGPAG